MENKKTQTARQLAQLFCVEKTRKTNSRWKMKWLDWILFFFSVWRILSKWWTGRTLSINSSAFNWRRGGRDDDDDWRRWSKGRQRWFVIKWHWNEIAFLFIRQITVISFLFICYFLFNWAIRKKKNSFSFRTDNSSLSLSFFVTFVLVERKETSLWYISDDIFVKEFLLEWMIDVRRKMCWVNTPETLLTYFFQNKGLRKISGVHYQRLWSNGQWMKIWNKEQINPSIPSQYKLEVLTFFLGKK